MVSRIAGGAQHPYQRLQGGVTYPDAVLEVRHQGWWWLMGGKHTLRNWLHMGHNEAAHSVLPMTSSEDVTSRLQKVSFPLPGKSPKPGRAPPRKWLHIDADAKVCCIKVSKFGQQGPSRQHWP